MCKELKGRAIPLAVSGAFHSPLMAEAAAEMAKPLKKADWSTPSMPVYMNVTGAAVTDPTVMLDLLSRQMTSSVRWIDTMGNLYADGARTFLEIGPKGVLSKMVKPNLEGKDDWKTLNVASLEAAEAFVL